LFSMLRNGDPLDGPSPYRYPRMAAAAGDGDGNQGKPKVLLEPSVVSDQISTIQRYLREEFGQFRMDEMIVVLLVGNMGVGKTTFMHVLADVNLTGVVNEGGEILLECDQASVLRDHKGRKYVMNSGSKGVTFLPNIYRMGRLLFVDCPGFQDEELAWRFINAFTTDGVLNAARYVKVLLLLSKNSFAVDNKRGADAREALRVIDNIFPNKAQLQKSLGIVITNGMKSFPASKTFEFNLKNEREWPLVQYLISKPNQIFNFPKAEPEQRYVLEDKEKVIRFLLDSPVERPEHKPAIDREGIYAASQIGIISDGHKKEAFDGIIKLLFKEVQKATSLEQIASYKSICNRLITAISTRSDLRRFTGECRALARMSPAFSEPLQKLENEVEVDEFVRRIMSLGGSQRECRRSFSLDVYVKPFLANVLEMISLKEKEKKGEEDKKKVDERLNDLEAKNRALIKRLNDQYIYNDIHDRRISGKFAAAGEALWNICRMIQEAVDSDDSS